MHPIRTIAFSLAILACIPCSTQPTSSLLQADNAQTIRMQQHLARGLDQGIVFMDDLRRDSACQAFLSTRFIERSRVGFPFDPALTPDDRTPFQPDAFDVLFFIRRSNAAANVRFPQGAIPVH